MVSILCTLSNLFQAHVMLVSSLRSPPKHTPLICRCPFTNVTKLGLLVLFLHKTLEQNFSFGQKHPCRHLGVLYFQLQLDWQWVHLLTNQTHCTKSPFGTAIFDEFFWYYTLQSNQCTANSHKHQQSLWYCDWHRSSQHTCKKTAL